MVADLDQVYSGHFIVYFQKEIQSKQMHFWMSEQTLFSSQSNTCILV